MLTSRCLLLGFFAMLAACSQSQYKLVAVDDLTSLQSCVAEAGSQHQMLLEQQRELQQGLQALTVELERSHQHIIELTQQPQECASVSPPQPLPDEPGTVDDVAKLVVGANERVRFEELGITLPARMDTGALLSAIQVDNMQAFERNGEDWVRFTIAGADTFERKMLRRATVTGVREKARPVIELRFTLGRLTQLAEFALTDTPLTGNPVRIGRMALRDVMVVDVSRDNIASTVDTGQ